MLPTDPYPDRNAAWIGRQPIVLAAVVFLVLTTGVTGIALSRAYTGGSPEQDRATAARRAAQASEQLVEKTKGLEVTQQQSIDQLQVVQDQLQGMKRLLTSQQADTKKLSDQIAGLTEAIEGLRQSFASAETADPSPSPATRNRSIRTRAAVHTVRTAHRVKPRS